MTTLLREGRSEATEVTKSKEIKETTSMNNKKIKLLRKASKQTSIPIQVLKREYIKRSKVDRYISERSEQ